MNKPISPSKASKKRPARGRLRTLALTKVRNASCSKAHTILQYLHESCNSHLNNYRLARAQRSFHSIWKAAKQSGGTILSGATRQVRGTSTDDEQDSLRAMLVTAASGLDAVVKQLVEDALPQIIKIDEKSALGLQKYVKRKLKNEIDDIDTSSTKIDFLANALISEKPHQYVIADYISYLKRGSLQSHEELLKIAAAFGIEPKDAHIDSNSLKPIFECRNKIIHELDINLDGERRKRHERGVGVMTKYSETLIATAEAFLAAIDNKLTVAK